MRKQRRKGQRRRGRELTDVGECQDAGVTCADRHHCRTVGWFWGFRLMCGNSVGDVVVDDGDVLTGLHRLEYGECPQDSTGKTVHSKAVPQFQPHLLDAVDEQSVVFGQCVFIDSAGLVDLNHRGSEDGREVEIRQDQASPKRGKTTITVIFDQCDQRFMHARRWQQSCYSIAPVDSIDP